MNVSPIEAADPDGIFRRVAEDHHGRYGHLRLRLEGRQLDEEQRRQFGLHPVNRPNAPYWVSWFDLPVPNQPFPAHYRPRRRTLQAHPQQQQKQHHQQPRHHGKPLARRPRPHPRAAVPGGARARAHNSDRGANNPSPGPSSGGPLNANTGALVRYEGGGNAGNRNARRPALAAPPPPT